jgi:predicted amidohydrolase
VQHYDKKHLFTLAGEDKVYTPGTQKLIVDYNGFKICPLICYDLRFPVWLRQLPAHPAALYLAVANWPEVRLPAWNALLSARAIENQAYVIGINRAADFASPNGTTPSEANLPIYAGGSAAHHPSGTLLHLAGPQPEVKLLELKHSDWQAFRTRFPFAADADSFELRTTPA